jgi:predicted molibdopterin-dependent oxidoreductase YjgC
MEKPMRNEIIVQVNGRPVAVPEGSTALTAIALAGKSCFRESVSGALRGPLCGMGICFECRVTIDRRAHQRSCQTICRPGMEIQTDEPQP